MSNRATSPVAEPFAVNVGTLGRMLGGQNTPRRSMVPRPTDESSKDSRRSPLRSMTAGTAGACTTWRAWTAHGAETRPQQREHERNGQPSSAAAEHEHSIMPEALPTCAPADAAADEAGTASSATT